ncbi:hypothetical protein BKA56DRAFT_132056 [Ilyonectria sp. MPI-CAGE-AT-0026]|nr:hypothetical protein BKA56DRAFT_132056 [Ilyonectria sp. MPI-CAGE-AT-0026]
MGFALFVSLLAKLLPTTGHDLLHRVRFLSSLRWLLRVKGRWPIISKNWATLQSEQLRVAGTFMSSLTTLRRLRSAQIPWGSCSPRTSTLVLGLTVFNSTVALSCNKEPSAFSKPQTLSSWA